MFAALALVCFVVFEDDDARSYFFLLLVRRAVGWDSLLPSVSQSDCVSTPHSIGPVVPSGSHPLRPPLARPRVGQPDLALRQHGSQGHACPLPSLRVGPALR